MLTTYSKVLAWRAVTANLPVIGGSVGGNGEGGDEHHPIVFVVAGGRLIEQIAVLQLLAQVLRDANKQTTIARCRRRWVN